MVGLPQSHADGGPDFQYSLCRVVLMVVCGRPAYGAIPCLSVLALSSRFDGQIFQLGELAQLRTFSTRSVESF